jgi:hypothetical protein
VPHGLALLLRSYRVVERAAGLFEPALQLQPQLGDSRTELAHPLQQLEHEAVRQCRGQLGDGAAANRLEPREVLLRFDEATTALGDLVREAPQVFDQAELQHARPGPQLTQRQRRDDLEGVDEPREPREIDARVAVPDELDRHRVHARHPTTSRAASFGSSP